MNNVSNMSSELSESPSSIPPLNKPILVLDLDHTLVHSIKSRHLPNLSETVLEKVIDKLHLHFIPHLLHYVSVRHGAIEFLCEVEPFFDIYIYTNSHMSYAVEVLSLLNQKIDQHCQSISKSRRSEPLLRKERMVARNDNWVHVSNSTNQLLPVSTSSAQSIESIRSIQTNYINKSPKTDPLPPLFKSLQWLGESCHIDLDERFVVILDDSKHVWNPSDYPYIFPINPYVSWSLYDFQVKSNELPPLSTSSTLCTYTNKSMIKTSLFEKHHLKGASHLSFYTLSLDASYREWTESWDYVMKHCLTSDHLNQTQAKEMHIHSTRLQEMTDSWAGVHLILHHPTHYQYIYHTFQEFARTLKLLPLQQYIKY